VSIKTRVRALEDDSGIARGDSGECACRSYNLDVRIYDNPDSQSQATADTAPGEVCEACGGEKRIIKVVYVEGRAA
jgi:hypothetical protein